MKARTAVQARYFDTSVQSQITTFCEKIAQDVAEASQIQRKNLTAESLVDRYGRENPGYINFDEFYEIYKNHVHLADDDNYLKPMPDDNLIRGLFNTLDPDQRHKISRFDFGNTIRSKGPISSFLTRLKKKILKGKERLHGVLLHECQQVDTMFGSHGELPLAVFQTIMIDYDLPLVNSDMVELNKKKYLFLDAEKNELVSYALLFKDLSPKQKIASVVDLSRHVIRIQAMVRAF